MNIPADMNRILEEAAAGKREALDRVFPQLYDELRRIAHRQLSRERTDHTLDTVALVNEAYLKLTGLDRITWQNRGHFMAVAAQAMRRVLATYAESKRTEKRGGRWRKLSLDEAPPTSAVELRMDELLALDAALSKLAVLSERQCRVVECRFFAGMEIDETAQALGIAAATVKRDWSIARAFLNRELSE